MITGTHTCLAQALADVSLGRLLHLVESKVPAQGGTLVKVDRFFPASQRRHRCGARKTALTFAERIFRCPTATCGYVGDCDLNAAQHMLAEAQRGAGAAAPRTRPREWLRRDVNLAWGWDVRPGRLRPTGDLS
jgi:transposase